MFFWFSLFRLIFLVFVNDISCVCQKRVLFLRFCIIFLYSFLIFLRCGLYIYCFVLFIQRCGSVFWFGRLEQSGWFFLFMSLSFGYSFFVYQITSFLKVESMEYYFRFRQVFSIAGCIICYIIYLGWECRDYFFFLFMGYN